MSSASQSEAERCILCGLALDEDPERTQDYHSGCHKVLAGTSVYDLFPVTRIDFYPQRARQEENKIRLWANSALTEALSLHFAQSSSTAQVQASRTSEVLRCIADSLLPEFLTMVTKARLTNRREREFKFLLTKPIFAQVADFQGTKYITALSNNQKAISASAIKIFEPLEGQMADIVYVAANHRGVVQIVVADANTWLEVDEVPDIWWFAIDIPCGECLLLAHHDGVKIRRLSAPEWCLTCRESQMDTQSDHFTAFPVPIDPRELRCVETTEKPGHMASITVNHAGMVGMTTFWQQLFSLIHIHRSGVANDSPKTSRADAACLYTPFDEGEVVEEIWVGTIDDDISALGMRTNKDRVLWHAYATQLEETTWVLADFPRGSVTTIYYGSDAQVGVGAIAFRSPSPSSEPLGRFDPLATIPPVPDFRYCIEEFFGGSIDLAGVVEVTFCRLEHKPEIISGMLFRFAGGHREALGEVRLNGLQEPMLLGGEGREVIYLEFGYDPTGVVPEHPNLLDASFARFEEPPEDLNPANHPDVAGHRFLEVSWEGTLEWWWSPLQCLIVYEGRASLEPRDAIVWLEFGG
ncbi:hypothetical protein F53441_2335 [Fusarium austroafricanum]|uniref:Uncharacterized protein n=1 Tax=Fusarium austroafricanum TaxID=2364996 RepID=A0A8H4KSK2_9HYPO|nr:hypothetical protein F53441_2335 [Fusarium austroafricanum]